MTAQDQTNDQRALLIDELLARQEEVLQQLEELDRRLMKTIEECRPPKVSADETSEPELNSEPVESSQSKAA